MIIYICSSISVYFAFHANGLCRNAAWGIFLVYAYIDALDA